MADNHTISIGAQGDNVAFWQQMAQSLYGSCSGYDITGRFGQGTKDAALIYQAVHGLSADGIVGPATWTSTKQHMEYNYQSNGVVYLSIGWGWGHYGPQEPHYAGYGAQVAKNQNATNAWKRYNGWDNEWYTTDHPVISTPGEGPFCD